MTKEKTKSNEVETNKRTQQVLQWLVELKPRPYVIQQGKELWGLETRQMDAYIAKANDLLAESFRQEADQMKSILIQRFVRIHDDAMIGHPKFDKGQEVGNDPDFSAANIALKNIGELYGLYKLKAEVEQRDPQLVSVPTEVLLKYAKAGGSNTTHDE